MIHFELKQSEPTKSLPWLALAVLTLTILVYSTGKTVAILSPLPEATSGPIIVDSLPPAPGTREAMWAFAWALSLPALWPLVARRWPVAARRVLVVGVFVVLALVFWELVAVEVWLAMRPPIQIILPWNAAG